MRRGVLEEDVSLKAFDIFSQGGDLESCGGLPPRSRRSMMPPTPRQNSQSSFEAEQGHFEVEDQTWSARDRTVIARTKQYLEENKSLKVEVEELESLLGPDDSDVDFRRIVQEARDEKRLRDIGDLQLRRSE